MKKYVKLPSLVIADHQSAKEQSLSLLVTDTGRMVKLGSKHTIKSPFLSGRLISMSLNSLQLS